jgi:hypothetical protein
MALLQFLFLKFVRTTSLIPLTQFQWNFTGLICSSSPCAHCTGFPVEWFLAELWTFDKKVFFLCFADTQKLVRTTHKLLVQFYPNVTGMISTKSSCALSICPSVTKVVPTTPHKLLGQFHSNFTGIYVATTPITSPSVTNLSQHEIGHHEGTHVITDRSCIKRGYDMTLLL